MKTSNDSLPSFEAYQSANSYLENLPVITQKGAIARDEGADGGRKAELMWLHNQILVGGKEHGWTWFDPAKIIANENPLTVEGEVNEEDEDWLVQFACLAGISLMALFGLPIVYYVMQATSLSVGLILGTVLTVMSLAVITVLCLQQFFQAWTGLDYESLGYFD